MLAKIFGYIFILAGTLFLLKPQLLKKRLQKKGLKKLRRLMFAIAMAAGVFFISTAITLRGLQVKVFLILGIIAIFKGTFLLRAKVADKFLSWFAVQPLNIFRLAACIYILLGTAILIFR